MKLLRSALAAILLAGILTTASAQIPTAGNLDLKRVLLSTGGVGYFEFEATVEGDAQLPLSVRLDQVDDVLKSIIVFDDKGGVGGIALPGRAPLNEAFRDLPFGQADMESPGGLLNALRGAEVIVGGPKQIAGRILKVMSETTSAPNGAETTRHRLTLMSNDGMRSVVLEEAETVRFADPAIQRQVDAALGAIARHRVQDQRTLTIQTKGTGKRALRVGYVVAAPLWKTSYRLNVPEISGAGAKGLLQGWAIVENLSGKDWKSVELTLVSGNPVTFRQSLYTAYFVNRPEVPVEVLGRVLPPADQGGMPAALAKAEQQRYQQEGALRARAVAPPAPAMAMAPGAAGGTAPPPAELIAAEAEEGATQVLFAASQPVTLPAGETLALPIINREAPVQRLALYQPGVNAAHPLAAVQVANDDGSGLPPGVLTLYERGKSGASYVGDARLAAFPAGEKRLLSFAVDQKISIDREMKPRQSVAQAAISRGVLTLNYRDEQTTVYRVKSPANEDRVLMIEHPRQADWELVAPKPADAEIARGQYRLRQALARTGQTTLEVATQRPRLSTVQLAGQSREALLGYSRTGGISEKARAALEQLAVLQGEVDKLDRAAKEAAGERDSIAKDQDRLRQNLSSVPAGGDLAKRYLEAMKKQEDRVDQLRLAEDDAKAKLRAARAALADAIAKTEI